MPVAARRRRYVRGLPVQGRFQGAPVQWLSLVTSFYGIRGAGLPREAGLCTRVSCARFLACGALKRCIPGAALRPRWNEAARESETVGARAGERCFGSARLGNREHCSSARPGKPVKTRFAPHGAARDVRLTCARSLRCSTRAQGICTTSAAAAIALSRKDPCALTLPGCQIAAHRRSARRNHARVVIRLPKPRAKQ